ncbi:MAG: DMT family transporter [Armatimonadetes bacterium]|nr:MAG: DMT family transporter [Armatimonadota bacterium]
MTDGRLSPFAASLLLAGVAVAWGAIPLFVRNDVSSTGLVGVRVTFGAIALIIVAAAVRKLRFPAMHRVRLVVCGLLLAAHWIAFFESIKLTTVAIALSVLYIGPIAASILSGPMLGQVVPRRLWFALGVAATGTIVVVQPWAIGEGGSTSLKGIAVAGIAAALLATLMIVGHPAARDLRGLTMSIGELTVASVVLAPATYGALTNHTDEMVSFIILGAVFTGLAGFLYWEVYRVIPVAAVSTIMYIEPASAVVWAMLFLDETPSPLTWVGIALVIVGGALATTSKRETDVVAAPVAL